MSKRKMICKHGLDEINCPICRISLSTRPINDLNSEMINYNPLKPENPFFKKHFLKKENSETSLFKMQTILKPNFINEITKPSILNKISNFKNKILYEKLEEKSIKKSDKFGISKKVSLRKPELNLELKD